MRSSLRKPVDLLQFLIYVVTLAVTATTAWAGVKNTVDGHERRIANLEASSSATHDNVIIIGEKLGLGARLRR